MFDNNLIIFKKIFDDIISFSLSLSLSLSLFLSLFLNKLEKKIRTIKTKMLTCISNDLSFLLNHQYAII